MVWVWKIGRVAEEFVAKITHSFHRNSVVVDWKAIPYLGSVGVRGGGCL